MHLIELMHAGIGGGRSLLIEVLCGANVDVCEGLLMSASRFMTLHSTTCLLRRESQCQSRLVGV